MGLGQRAFSQFIEYYSVQFSLFDEFSLWAPSRKRWSRLFLICTESSKELSKLMMAQFAFFPKKKIQNLYIMLIELSRNVDTSGWSFLGSARQPLRLD